jgi:hypothetical protein
MAKRQSKYHHPETKTKQQSAPDPLSNIMRRAPWATQA